MKFLAYFHSFQILLAIGHPIYNGKYVCFLRAQWLFSPLLSFQIEGLQYFITKVRLIARLGIPIYLIPICPFADLTRKTGFGRRKS